MNPGQQLLILSLRLYKLLVSPALHVLCGPLGGCRFTPTCSPYAAEAVALHGMVKGTLLAVRRICRCHPWGGCGEDPVPGAVRLQNFSVFRWKSAPTSACCHHVETQRPAHFGCPPPSL